MLIRLVFMILMCVGSASAQDVEQHNAGGEIYLRLPNHNYLMKLDAPVKVIQDEKAKAKLSISPFAGLNPKPKKKIYSYNRKWFEERVDELLAFYLKHTGKDIFKISKNKPMHMLFLCRAFIQELGLAYNGQDGFENREKLHKELTEKYMKQAFIYASKFQDQKRVRNAPKFKSLVKVLQPMMSVFMYGNPWVVMSECIRTSEKFTRGKKVYREYFLNVEVMTVMRRRYRIDASEKSLIASILKMEDVVFMEYQRECARRWIDEKQYVRTKYEKAKKIKDIPDDLKADHLLGRLP